MTLLDDLTNGEAATNARLVCSLCSFIVGLEDNETREALTRAAGGSIGRDKLISILKKYETGIGHRTIDRHRREEHRP